MADYATLVFDIDSTQARGAAKSLADLNSAAIKAANSAASIGTTMRDANGRFQQAAKLTEKNIREVESLAKAYNPLLAAQIRYKEEVLRTATAVKAGVITEQQRVDILQRTKAELDGSAAAARRLEAEERKVAAAAERAAAASARASGAVKTFGKSQETATHHATNLSFQLNDIGMMMASGQNPFMLMIQQGPQVAQIFSQMNAEGRKIGPTLAGAFRMFLNPTTLATLAVIGLSAALVKFGTDALGASKPAKSLEDSMTALDGVSSRLSESSRILASNDFESLRLKYGEVTREVWALVEAQGKLASLQMAKEVRDLKAALTDITSGSMFDIGISAAASGVLALQKQLKVSRNDAISLYDSIDGLKNAKGPKETADALARIGDLVKQYAIEQGVANDAALKLYENIVNAEASARQAAAASDSWAGAMSGVLSYTNAVARALSNISGTGIQLAAVKAETDALRAGASLRESSLRSARLTAELEGGKKTAELLKQGDILGAMSANTETMGKLALINAQDQLGVEQERARLREREAAKGSGGGSKGGGGVGAAERKAATELKSAEKGFQSLRELLEKESLYQVAEYEKRQMQLDAANQKKLISEQNYQLMKEQLQVAFFGSEYQRNELQYQMDLQQLDKFHADGLLKENEYLIARANLHSSAVSRMGQEQDNRYGNDLQNMSKHFGEMAALAGDHNDKFLRAQKIFGAAAALVSTYTGAAKALELPFPYNLMAAGKVIAAGMGFISAIRGGGGSGGGGGGSTATATSVKEEPVRNVLLRLEGDQWLTGMAEQLITQFYEASENGRVIVARDYS